MNLKDFFASRTGKENDFYWALVIESGWVQGGLWMIKEEKAEVIAVSPPTAWIEDSELIEAADTALSAAVQNLPEEIGEPTKTVFGVPPSWVSEGQIKEEFLEKIKKVCVELSLEPSGFVVLPEAFAHLFKSEEGSPLNAIIMGVDRDTIELTVFKLGNLVGTTAVSRSVSTADDVVEGLSRFNIGDQLPSRFLIYDGKEGELEEVRQAIIEINWEGKDKIHFLHTPKVEIITPENKVLATALAGASEIASVSIVEKVHEEKKASSDLPSNKSYQESNISEARPSDFGFVVEQDIADTTKKKELTEETSKIVASEIPTATTQPRKNPLGNIFKKVGSYANSLFGARPPSFPQSAPRKSLIFGGSFLGILIVGFLIFWWFYPKAEVTIYISPEKLREEISLVVDTNLGATDFAASKISGEIFKTEISGEKTKSATGSKKVGERAKGTVKIQNGTASVVNLSAGTILVAANDLAFSLDSGASISAALSPSSPGVANVEVTGDGIGAEYNLARDESFKVGNYPKADVDALATNDFSGGSSRDITAVSEEDREVLREELTAELLNKSKEEAKKSVRSEKLLIEGSLTSSVASEKFSNQAGDEADSLKLTLEVAFEGVVINKKDLLDLSKEVLKDKIPSGFVLREDQIDALFELSDQNEGIYEFDTNLSVNLLPEVRVDDITKKIAGRTPSAAQSFLASVSGFNRVEIKLKPKFPSILGTLPHVAKNIEVEVTSDR